MNVSDVQPTLEFLEDWERAPAITRQQVDTKLRLIHQAGKLPPSFNAHRAHGRGGLWIGHVTFGGMAHRILFTVEEGVLILHRLLTHTEMEDYFLNQRIKD